MTNTVDPGYERVFEIVFSFAYAQVLFAAVDVDVFSQLSGGPLSCSEIVERTAMHPRGAPILLDSLVFLGLLQHDNSRYANTATAERYLVRSAPEFVGDFFPFAADRLYSVWRHLPEAIRTGIPQNEAKTESDYYSNLWASRERHKKFLNAMDAATVKAGKAIATQFPWRHYSTFCDIGGARGALAVELATTHPHLCGGTFDLPAVSEYFDELVAGNHLQHSLRFHAGNFFTDPLPRADVVIMGQVLHNWGPEEKQLLLKKAFDALPSHGAVIVYEWFLQESGGSPLGHLMGLNMLLVTHRGSTITAEDCRDRMYSAGFKQVDVVPISGPSQMIVGWKSKPPL